MNRPIPIRENAKPGSRIRIDTQPGSARREGRKRAGCEYTGNAAMHPRMGRAWVYTALTGIAGQAGPDSTQGSSPTRCKT